MHESLRRICTWVSGFICGKGMNEENVVWNPDSRGALCCLRGGGGESEHWGTTSALSSSDGSGQGQQNRKRPTFWPFFIFIFSFPFLIQETSTSRNKTGKPTSLTAAKQTQQRLDSLCSWTPPFAYRNKFLPPYAFSNSSCYSTRVVDFLRTLEFSINFQKLIFMEFRKTDVIPYRL